MKLTMSSVLVALSASTYLTTSTAFAVPLETLEIECRETPSHSSKISQILLRPEITISCRTTTADGQIWGKTPEGCFVPDDDDEKPLTDGADECTPNTPRAEASATAGSVPGPRRDDYKYKSSCSKVDPWYFYTCQGTSFVAQRINERLGIKFNGRYKGVVWGNAKYWDNAAKSVGIKVDGNPKPGAIAQSDAGSVGHVAWVSAVQGSKVILEEYNFTKRQKYDTRTAKKSDYKYIHFTSST